MDTESRPLTVSKLPEAAGVELSTIRYYERRGLVKPLTRRASGYREYDHDAIRCVRFIRHEQELGFSLDEIAELMALRMKVKGAVRMSAGAHSARSRTSAPRSSASTACARHWRS